MRSNFFANKLNNYIMNTFLLQNHLTEKGRLSSFLKTRFGYKTFHIKCLLIIISKIVEFHSI